MTHYIENKIYRSKLELKDSSVYLLKTNKCKELITARWDDKYQRFSTEHGYKKFDDNSEIELVLDNEKLILSLHYIVNTDLPF